MIAKRSKHDRIVLVEDNFALTIGADLLIKIKLNFMDVITEGHAESPHGPFKRTEKLSKMTVFKFNFLKE